MTNSKQTAAALPTRISVEPSDPGFAAYGELLAIGDVDVYLDGTRRRGIITADAAEGFLECYDPDGETIDAGADDLPTIVLRGLVRIESRPNPRTDDEYLAKWRGKLRDFRPA